MTEGSSLTPRQRRRVLTRSTVRSLVTVAVVVALYYLFPLDRLEGIPVGIPLAVGLLVLAADGAWEIQAVVGAEYPSVRARESLARFVPVFLVLFAACYYLMVKADPTSFSAHPMTRTDALYFTLTVFSTVGFGDITAASQVARGVVMVQMVLDLILVGLGVRLLTQAVHVGVSRRRGEESPEDPTSPSTATG